MSCSTVKAKLEHKRDRYIVSSVVLQLHTSIEDLTISPILNGLLTLCYARRADRSDPAQPLARTESARLNASATETDSGPLKRDDF
jgi:hypothetical protein